MRTVANSGPATDQTQFSITSVNIPHGSRRTVRRDHSTQTNKLASSSVEGQSPTADHATEAMQTRRQIGSGPPARVEESRGPRGPWTVDIGALEAAGVNNSPRSRATGTGGQGADAGTVRHVAAVEDHHKRRTQRPRNGVSTSVLRNRDSILRAPGSSPDLWSSSRLGRLTGESEPIASNIVSLWGEGIRILRRVSTECEW